ncbi:hypothetical protein [Bacteroides sp. 519]|uniref:hypothetical protein n=1 Tax=Bacteroides sp. 519 TaxID=2302937 RepID=UPI0013D543A4|nr:hypothetical protein [Bacteroides sp. 519]NDV59152.1 hypothetical protein [Bacteroides sp. 519]
MKKLLMYMFGCLLLASCQNEEVTVVSTHGLQLSVKASGTLATRAVSGDNNISSLQVLYFGLAEDDEYYLMDVETVSGVSTLPSTSGGTPSVINLTNPTQWAESDAYYANLKVAVFANASTSLTGLGTTAGSASGSTGTASDGKKQVNKLGITTNSTHLMSTVLESITFGNVIAANTGSTLFEDNYIPMYVLADDVKIFTGPYTADWYVSSDGTSATHSLLRAVAKVDITNNAAITDPNTPSGSPKLYAYTITKVSIVNGNSGGWAYHPSSAFATTDNDRVKEATVLDAKATGVDTDVASGLTTTTNTQTISNFYMYEKIATNVNGNFDKTTDCYILIEGNRSDGKTPSYMIPFPYLGVGNHAATQTGSPYTYSPTATGSVLRNHYYKFVIEGVTDSGLRIKLYIKDWTEVTVNTDPIQVS